MDGPNIIGLVDVTGGGAISLEPGGQFELSGAPVETVHQTALRTDGASRAAQGDRASARHRLPRSRHEPEMDAGPDAGDAEGPLPDHDRLHAEGRPPRPRHDVPHLHGADEPRLFVRSRHGEEAARLARAAAGRDRAVRELAVHRRQAERVPLVPLGDLARHRHRARRHAAVRASSPAWASSAMSTTRSTCRCISSSARTSTSTCRACRSATCSPASFPVTETARDAVRLGQPRLDDFSRGAAQALPGDARRRRRAVAAAAGAAGVLGRHPLRRCLPSMPRGIW